MTVLFATTITRLPGHIAILSTSMNCELSNSTPLRAPEKYNGKKDKVNIHNFVR